MATNQIALPDGFVLDEPVAKIQNTNKPELPSGFVLDKPPSFLPGYQRTEQKIVQRPSAVDVLREEVAKPYSGNILKKVVKAGVTGLKIIAVPLERAESAAANVGMKMQEGDFSPVSLGKEAIKGVTGERKGQFGDIPRRAGVPEPISATIGLFTSMKALNPTTKGKLVVSAKKAEQFVTSKLPKVMGKDYLLNRAQKAAGGLDDLYSAVSKEYDTVYDKIGKIQVDVKDVQSVVDDLPQNVVSNISKSKLLTRTVSGEIIPDMNNLKIIKGIIKKSVPDKIWSGKAIGDLNTAALEQAYGKINGIMSKSSTELQGLNKKYGDFMQMRKTISRILYDADGNIQANGLARLYGSGGERGKQVFFEQFGKQWPQAQQIIKDTVKFNRRQSLKRVTVKGALLFGGYEAGRRFIAQPLIDNFSGQ